MTVCILYWGNSSLGIFLFRFHPCENRNWLEHRASLNNSEVTTCQWFFEWDEYMIIINCCAIFSWLKQLEKYLNHLDQLVWIHLSMLLLALQVPYLSFRMIDSRQHMQQSCSYFEWVEKGRHLFITENHVDREIFTE